jgi:two-component system response regulator QseB
MRKFSKNILIVEDEKVLRDAYVTILKLQGHKVRAAGNGIEGLKKLKEEKPDLILLDIFMPQMDGREFLKNFDVSEYPSTTVLVLSNVSDKHTEHEVLANGAKRFLLKADLGPVDLIKIVEEI